LLFALCALTVLTVLMVLTGPAAADPAPTKQPEWSSPAQSTDTWRVATSADGGYNFVGANLNSGKNWVYLYDQHGNELWNYSMGNYYIYAIDISASGDRLAVSSSSGSVYYFSSESWEPIWVYEFSYAEAVSVAISADGKYVAAGSLDGDVALIDQKGDEQWSHHQDNGDFTKVAISADGGYIATFRGNTNLNLYNINGAQLWQKYLGYSPTTVKISADGDRVLAACYNEALNFFHRNGTNLWNYVLDSTHILDADLSAEGDYVTFVTPEGTYTNRLFLLNKIGSKLWDLEIDAYAEHVAIADNGSHIATSDPDRTYIFPKAGGSPLWTGQNNGYSGSRVALSADGSYLLTHDASQARYYWNGDYRAVIDSVTPALSAQGVAVEFAGHGEHAYPVTAYQWNSSLDGLLSDQAAFSTASLSVGTHDITFRVQNQYGVWSGWKTRQVEVSANTLPVASLLAPTPAMPVAGLECLLRGEGADTNGTVVLYEWDPYGDGTGLFTSDASTAGFTYPDPGSFTLGLRVQDDDGAWSEPVELKMDVTGKPTASLPGHGPERPRAMEVVTLSGEGSDPDGQVAAYRWDLYGDGRVVMTTTEPTADFIYPAAGEYTVRFYVQDDDGTWSEPVEMNVTVAPAKSGGDDDDSPAPPLMLTLALVSAVAVLSRWRRIHH